MAEMHPNHVGFLPAMLARREDRERAAEAHRISQLIDEDLRRDLEAQKRRHSARPQVKVMLLGQAESGKSTLRKQFQLCYSQSELDAERPAWVAVVHSNILRGLRTIVDALDAGTVSPSRGSTSSRGKAGSVNSRGSASTAGVSIIGSGLDTWPSTLRATRAALKPLILLEDALAGELSGGIGTGLPAGAQGRGAYVRADWQALFGVNDWLNGSATAAPPSMGMDGPVARIVRGLLSEATLEIEALWTHPQVRVLVEEKMVELDECVPYFLDHISRIANPAYVPDNEDILHVRLRTLGIAAHTFDINIRGRMCACTLYDVGGARGQRPSWIPFFDDANAIIFLAPISAFDQFLEEDPRVNRILDSLQLWTAICTNKLLAKAALILLLNKTDLLRKKLEAGIKVRKFITSYGDRENTWEEVSEYFRCHFIQVQKRKDSSKRALYVQFSSMLDVEDSRRIILHVNDSILRQHLAASGLSL